MKFLKNFMMFLVAFNPMFLILVLKSVIQIETSKDMGWTSFNHWTVVSLITIFIITLIIGVVYVFKPSDKNTVKIEIISAKNLTDNYFLGYFSLFVLSALYFDISNPYMLIVLAIIIMLIAIVYLVNNLYYINPLFNLLGYKFMKIKYRNVNGTIEHEANIFTRRSLEKEISSVLVVENSEFDFSREVKTKKPR